VYHHGPLACAVVSPWPSLHMHTSHARILHSAADTRLIWGDMCFGDDWCRQPHRVGAVRDSFASPPHPLPPPASAARRRATKRARQQGLFTELRKLLDAKLRIAKHTLQVSWAHVGMADHITSMPGTSLCCGHTRAIAL